jgi:peptidyl-prolyl cis-trans isomerase D
VQVTKVTSGNTVPFDQAKAGLRDRLLASKAADLMYERANKIDQVLGNGGNFDEIPGDLGVAGMSGTLDAAGMTTAGQSAPIPGPAELRKAIIASAFEARQGDPPQLVEVQTPSAGGSAYYALMVESIEPPAAKPFATVKDQVAEDWKQDQRHKAADKAATAMMTAAQGGKSFSDAALIAGVSPKLSPAITRDEQNPEVPPELQRVMFSLKSGETTMVEVPDGFVVAKVVEVIKPDPAQDKAGFEKIKATLNRSLGSDLANEFADAARARAKPQINQANYDSIVQAH